MLKVETINTPGFSFSFLLASLEGGAYQFQINLSKCTHVPYDNVNTKISAMSLKS